MRDIALRQRFLQESSNKEISFESIANAIKIKETSREQMDVINHKKENLDYVRDQSKKYYNKTEKQENYNKYNKNKVQHFSKYNNTERPKDTKTCTKCNRLHGPRQCKAYNTKCTKCDKTGHWAICCNTKFREAYEINSKSDQRIVFLNEVNKPIQDLDWNKEVQIQIRGYKKNVVMKIDTGASVTAIPYRSSIPNI